MNIRSIVTTQFKRVGQEYGRPVAELSDDLELLESGLDSLCLGIVVMRLEGELGVDPFSSSEDTLFPVTFGDFVMFYERACK